MHAQSSVTVNNVEHIDFGGNRDVLVNMDVRYHDVPGRKSVAVESLYDYVQWRLHLTMMHHYTAAWTCSECSEAVLDNTVLVLMPYPGIIQ